MAVPMSARPFSVISTQKSGAGAAGRRVGAGQVHLRSVSTEGGSASLPTDAQVNILIVDDEPKNLTVLETVLDEPGYRVLRAESGEQALLALMENEFAVLVLDIRMPGMSGFELAQMVKGRRKTARVPIIFLTAYYNEDQHVLTGYDTGAVDYLHKPVNAQVLRSKVAVFAELYRKGRALELSNAALLAEVTERRRAEAQLRDLNETLDRRVIDRTQELNASNAGLMRMETQLRDIDRRKDEFLATLAHELRNPLAPVRNAVHILQLKGANSPELKWACDVLERQVHAMTRLIDDLMDISRINLDRIELRREPVELAAVIHRAVESSRPLIDESGHELAIALPEGPLLIDADPIRLAQVFMNLLNNAAKYMDRGGRIELSAFATGNEVGVSIKDAGIGISAERIASLFTMFSQVERALSRTRGGLGIGLALARRLVELHGGRISAHSDGLGRGAEFLVHLPQIREGVAAAGSVPAAEPNSPGVGLRILVADDNEDAALALAALLEILGHTVRTAFDGEAAVRVAAEFEPEVALLDIGMPTLNGFEACQRIRAQPRAHTMTLIAVTGWGQADDRRLSKEAGFDHHLVKPVDPKVMTELLSAVAKRQPAGVRKPVS
jgi:signal transduction histidine kinase